MNKATIIVLGVIGAILLVVLGAFGSAASTYNKFVHEQANIDAQSKQVDVAYQTEFRLVPRITDLAQQYMGNEARVQTSIAALRSGYGAALNGTFPQKEAYAAQIGGFMSLLRTENYPNLQAAALIQEVMDETINLENKIAVEKTRYNDQARDYNAHRRECCFPVMIANMFDFGARDYIGYTDRPNQSSFGNQTL